MKAAAWKFPSSSILFYYINKPNSLLLMHGTIAPISQNKLNFSKNCLKIGENIQIMLRRFKSKIISSGVIIERTAPYVPLSYWLIRSPSIAEVLCWDVPSWANEKQISGRIVTILDDLTCLYCMLWRFSRRKFWWEPFLYVCSLSSLRDSAACLYYRCPLFGTLVYFEVQCLSTSRGYVLWRDFYLSSSRGSVHHLDIGGGSKYGNCTVKIQKQCRICTENMRKEKNFCTEGLQKLYRKNAEIGQKTFWNREFIVEFCRKQFVFCNTYFRFRV